MTSNDQSWGSDNSNFVDADNPWSIRGGNSNNGSNAGLFSANSNNGNANNNIGFRAVQRVANKRSYRALRRRRTCTHTLRSQSFSAVGNAATFCPEGINTHTGSSFLVGFFIAEHQGLLFLCGCQAVKTSSIRPQLFGGVVVAASVERMAKPGVDAALKPLLAIQVLFKILNDLA